MKKILLSLLMLFISVTAIAVSPSPLPTNMNFPDGLQVKVEGNQVVTISKNNQILSQSWFGDNGYDYWQSVKFVQQLQKAVKDNDKNAIADLIHYPLRINHGGAKHTNIKDKAEFLQQFDTIFTSAVQDKIKQVNPYNLFCNSQGVMFSNGLIWLTHPDNNAKDLKISVVNL